VSGCGFRWCKMSELWNAADRGLADLEADRQFVDSVFLGIEQLADFYSLLWRQLMALCAISRVCSGVLGMMTGNTKSYAVLNRRYSRHLNQVFVKSVSLVGRLKWQRPCLPLGANNATKRLDVMSIECAAFFASALLACVVIALKYLWAPFSSTPRSQQRRDVSNSDPVRILWAFVRRAFLAGSGARVCFPSTADWAGLWSAFPVRIARAWRHMGFMVIIGLASRNVMDSQPPSDVSKSSPSLFSDFTHSHSLVFVPTAQPFTIMVWLWSVSVAVLCCQFFAVLSPATTQGAGQAPRRLILNWLIAIRTWFHSVIITCHVSPYKQVFVS
jgi:hypothetical protein